MNQVPIPPTPRESSSARSSNSEMEGTRMRRLPSHQTLTLVPPLSTPRPISFTCGTWKSMSLRRSSMWDYNSVLNPTSLVSHSILASATMVPITWASWRTRSGSLILARGATCGPTGTTVGTSAATSDTDGWWTEGVLGAFLLCRKQDECICDQRACMYHSAINHIVFPI